MSEAQNYLKYTHQVLGVKYVDSHKKNLSSKLTVIFDKNLGVQEQLVFTKIAEAIGLKDFNSIVLPPGQELNELIKSTPSQKIICFVKPQFSGHGVFDIDDQNVLFTHSIEDLVGSNSDSSLMERKKQTWSLLKNF